MQGKTRERWLRLCELVADEHDPQRVSELVNELCSILDRKLHRLEIENAAVGELVAGKSLGAPRWPRDPDGAPVTMNT